MDTRQKIAQKLIKIANEPKAAKLTLILPKNDIGLPEGIFIFSTFLRYVADCLQKP